MGTSPTVWGTERPREAHSPEERPAVLSPEGQVVAN